MTIPASANPLLLKAPAGGDGYAIERSLRFNSSDSAYLSRVPSANSTSQTTFTWAGWIKQSSFNASGRRLFFYTGASAGTGSFFSLEFNNDRLAVIFDGAGSYWPKTAAVFRDPSAWMHIVIAVDTTQATAANRCNFYVNGSQQTSLVDTQPPQNHAVVNGTTSVHRIASNSNATSFSFNGYLADVHFIDGQALDPTSFGEFDANGIWQPKAYTGTYGTNGFHLDFADNSTAAALGTDTSGNGNTWTVNNLSVTAGAGNDSLVDVPTNGTETDTGIGEEVRGNYCTWNPLANGAGSLSNGNLDLGNSGPDTRCNSTISVSSGKWYYEITLNTLGTNSSAGIGQNQITTVWPGNDALSYAFELDNARTASNGSLVSYGSALGAGDVFMCAFDLDNNKIFFGKNGTWFNSSDPAAGTNAAFTLSAGSYCPIGRPYGGGSFSLNAGQRPFAYTAPSGFNALCTANLPEGTITTSGTFTGNANSNGPFVYLNGVPTAMTINGNAVTFATHADKLSNGFKLRTSSTSYNTSGSNTYSITTTGDKFKFARAQPNP